MKKKLNTIIVAPNGNEHPVKSVDEGVRFMAIISNGYMDVNVDTLTEQMTKGGVEKYTFGGWTVKTVTDSAPVKVVNKYTVTKGAVSETASSSEAIAHICDCSINTVVARLRNDVTGFTVKGWKVSLVVESPES